MLNDSTIPFGEPKNLADCVERMAGDDNCTNPQLAGFTDSAERNTYHLQSYGLLANNSLICHPAWINFWKNLNLAGNKDSLIDRGEIGLSQALLRANIKLRAEYSLINILANDRNAAKELHSLKLNDIKNVNLSLHAWRSLVRKEFPLIKKRAIFELINGEESKLALTRLRKLLKGNDAIFLSDLQALLKSKF